MGFYVSTKSYNQYVAQGSIITSLLLVGGVDYAA